MIRAFLYNRSNKELKTGGQELCGLWRQNPDTLLWLDLVDENADSERRLLQQEFGLHQRKGDRFNFDTFSSARRFSSNMPGKRSNECPKAGDLAEVTVIPGFGGGPR